MTDDAKKAPSKRGVKRGGKRFPMYPLAEAVTWSNKLVSKTYNSPQPADIIKASVVESTSSVGDVKISVLKQFGLMEGDSKQYNATALARAIKSSPQEELPGLLGKAALEPEIFKQLFATYHGDETTVAKLRQRAADLGVHPDSAAKCIDVYVESLIPSGLAVRQGDSVKHASEDGQALADSEDQAPYNDGQADEPGTSIAQGELPTEDIAPPSVRRGLATVQVNIAVDSSLDTEKLQKQLELLRQYGAL